jgi:hypothetical protein
MAQSRHDAWCTECPDACKKPRRPVQERRGPTVAVTGGIHWGVRPRAVIKPIQAEDWRSFRAGLAVAMRSNLV